jgi:hypothetical protein
MWADEGKLYVKKGFYSFRKLYKALRTCERAFPDSDFVIHFRIATSGDDTIVNLHPHKVNDNVAFVHNGILTDYSWKTFDFSDTYMFNQEVLQNFPEKFMDLDMIMETLDQYCREEISKMIFMNNLGETIILNEDSGAWDYGCWFSNTSYKWGTITRCASVSAYGHRDPNWWQNEDIDYTDRSLYEYCDMCGRYLPTAQFGEIMICEDCRPHATAYKRGTWLTTEETSSLSTASDSTSSIINTHYTVDGSTGEVKEENSMVITVSNEPHGKYLINVKTFFNWIYTEAHKPELDVGVWVNWIDNSMDVVFGKHSNILYRVPQAITDEHAGLEELLSMIKVGRKIPHLKPKEEILYGSVCPKCGCLNKPYTEKQIGKPISCTDCNAYYLLLEFRAKELLVCPFCGMTTVLENNNCRFCQTYLGQTDIMKYNDCIK